MKTRCSPRKCGDDIRRLTRRKSRDNIHCLYNTNSTDVTSRTSIGPGEMVGDSIISTIFNGSSRTTDFEFHKTDLGMNPTTSIRVYNKSWKYTNSQPVSRRKVIGSQTRVTVRSKPCEMSAGAVLRRFGATTEKCQTYHTTRTRNSTSNLKLLRR